MGLPIISEEVKRNLLADLNLDTDSVSQRIVAGITGERPDNPTDRAEALVRDVFSDILVTKPSFATGILTTLKEIGDFWDFRINGFTIGMAVVISAVDKMSDQSLTEKFDRLTNEDVIEALNDIRGAASLTSDRTSILEQVLNAPRIPEQQINLNQVINKLSKQIAPGMPEARMGASAMYQILSKNWSKLTGNNNLPPTSLE